MRRESPPCCSMVCGWSWRWSVRLQDARRAPPVARRAADRRSSRRDRPPGCTAAPAPRRSAPGLLPRAPLLRRPAHPPAAPSALPGRAGLDWLSCGAQPVTVSSRSTGLIPSGPAGNRASAIGSSARGGTRPSRASTAFVSPAVAQVARAAPPACDRRAAAPPHPPPAARSPRAAAARPGPAAPGRARRAARRRRAAPLSAAASASRSGLQRAEPGQRGQEQPVRPEAAPDLHQRPRQVVHPVQRQVRHDQVEALRREGQPFLVARHRQAAPDSAAMRADRSIDTTKPMPRAAQHAAPPRPARRCRARGRSGAWCRPAGRAAARPRPPAPGTRAPPWPPRGRAGGAPSGGRRSASGRRRACGR